MTFLVRVGVQFGVECERALLTPHEDNAEIFIILCEIEKDNCRKQHETLQAATGGGRFLSSQ
jgi:hypothetical protein